VRQQIFLTVVNTKREYPVVIFGDLSHPMFADYWDTPAPEPLVYTKMRLRPFSETHFSLETDGSWTTVKIGDTDDLEKAAWALVAKEVA
jgi:hypothetical protein